MPAICEASEIRTRPVALRSLGASATRTTPGEFYTRPALYVPVSVSRSTNLPVYRLYRLSRLLPARNSGLQP